MTDEEDPSTEAVRVAAALQELASPLSGDVQVWRGIRSIEDTFGTTVDGLKTWSSRIVNRFMSTTVHRDLACGEFLQPGSDPAVLKVTARAGSYAIWVPPIGSPEHAYQGELLFTRGHPLRILSVGMSGEVPLIEVEVRRP
ncbi:hypothetical protein KIH27_04655 [Mycobacterium sp. M1]|uniref:Uncharacterized protein n=1 Tax=Mycolicibacter acidiphilus TaxID=2835306 RepID=A0ABS5RF23_9MYCO|nr:hypothetical protein [Mycolicibacter acidiphilus]MBS9532877.1 hypothetical protein [Mycolicibacter acidiphilus]